MPTIPGPLDVSRAPRPTDPGFDAGKVGRSVSQLGVEVQRQVERQERIQAANARSQALLSYNRALSDRLRELETKDEDIDPIKEMESFGRKQSSLYVSKLPEGLSRESRDAIQRELDGVQAEHVQRAAQLSTKRLKSRAEQTLIESRNESANWARKNPYAYRQAIASFDKIADGYAGAMDDESLRQIKRTGKQSVLETTVGGLLDKGDFNGARILIASGEFDDSATPDSIKGLESAIDIAERAADTKTDKLLRDRMEQNSAVLFAGIMDGTVRDEDLRKALAGRDIEGDDYISLRKALQSQSTVSDDDHIAAELWMRIYEGEDSNQLRRAIRGAVGRGQLSGGTVNSMLSRLETEADFTKDSRYKLAVDRVKREVQTTGPLQALDTDEQSRISQALEELYLRVQDGEDPLKLADELIPRARLRRELPASGFLRPRFGVYRNGKIDIDASIDRAAEAYQSGRIDWATYRAEADQLARIRLEIEEAEARRAADQSRRSQQ